MSGLKKDGSKWYYNGKEITADEASKLLKDKSVTVVSIK